MSWAVGNREQAARSARTFAYKKAYDIILLPEAADPWRYAEYPVRHSETRSPSRPRPPHRTKAVIGVVSSRFGLWLRAVSRLNCFPRRLCDDRLRGRDCRVAPRAPGTDRRLGHRADAGQATQVCWMMPGGWCAGPAQSRSTPLGSRLTPHPDTARHRPPHRGNQQLITSTDNASDPRRSRHTRPTLRRLHLVIPGFLGTGREGV